MNKMKSPALVLGKLLMAVLVPVILGLGVAQAFGVALLANHSALAMIIAGTYVSAAAYLLAQSPMLLVRVRVGLFLSVMAVAGILVALLVSPAQSQAGVLALMVFAVFSSMPLVAFGVHNVLLSLKQARTAA